VGFTLPLRPRRDKIRDMKTQKTKTKSDAKKIRITRPRGGVAIRSNVKAGCEEIKFN
jgi:hypothetical protein